MVVKYCPLLDDDWSTGVSSLSLGLSLPLLGIGMPHLNTRIMAFTKFSVVIVPYQIFHNRQGWPNRSSVDLAFKISRKKK